MIDKFLYAYADETGDTGFAFERGSSRYFAIALVLTNHPEHISQQVKRLRVTLRLSAQAEFKFHGISNNFRNQFLSMLQSLPVAACVILIDKTELAGDWQQVNNSVFYARCLAELVTQIPKDYLDGTILTLDQFGPLKRTRTAIRHELKGLGRRPFKRINMKRSQGNDLIQCADMVAGAVMRNWQRQDNQFLRLIENKVTVWQFPHNENPPS